MIIIKNNIRTITNIIVWCIKTSASAYNLICARFCTMITDVARISSSTWKKTNSTEGNRLPCKIKCHVQSPSVDYIAPPVKYPANPQIQVPHWICPCWHCPKIQQRRVSYRRLNACIVCRGYVNLIRFWCHFDADLCRLCSFVQHEHLLFLSKIQLRTMLTLMCALTMLWK